MKIKKVFQFSSVILLFFCLGVSSAEAQDKSRNVVLENNEVIKKRGKVVGRLEIIEDKEKASKSKIVKYLVKIYDTKNTLIAIYNVKSGTKKNSQIYEATLNTLTDRVTHAGSNFIDYKNLKKDNEEDTLQVSAVLAYLSHYKYI